MCPYKLFCVTNMLLLSLKKRSRKAFDKKKVFHTYDKRQGEETVGTIYQLASLISFPQ